MTASLKAIDGSSDLSALMHDLAARARAAARLLALAPTEQKNRALEAMERAIRAHATAILAANAEDIAEAKGAGMTAAFLDRLTLTPARIDEGGKGASLRPVRRQQDDLAIAAFHVGGEDGGHALAGHGLAEDQIAIGEVDADVFFDEGEIADAVALFAIEAVLADGARQIGGLSAQGGEGKQQDQKQKRANHDP